MVRIRSLASVVLALTVSATACVSEPPERAALRERLKQPAQMSQEELGRTLDEIAKTIQGKAILVQVEAATKEMNQEQRDVVLGMLTDRVGVFDEGLRTDNGVTLRILNAPGLSTNPEFSAARRLLVDINTFIPRRFEFNHEVAGLGDYGFDLTVK